jgi:hypothetical protein
MAKVRSAHFLVRVMTPAVLLLSIPIASARAQDSRPTTSDTQQSDSAPMPPRRPADLSVAPPPAPATVSNDACIDALRDEGLEFERVEPTGGQCAIETPVRLLRLARTADVREVGFPEKPILSCPFARTFSEWTRRVAAPLARGTMNDEIVSIHTGPGFECRTRNRQAGGKMSAHASGLALDVAAFGLTGNRRLPITDRRPEHEPFLNALRKASCGWFTTILGPGSDPFHADHWHLDTIQHGSSLNYRICQ